MIPEVYRIEKKTRFQIYDTFNGSSLGYNGRTIECETLFKFHRAEKGFVDLETRFFDSIHLGVQ
jgi:hypothetical protein